MTDAWDVGALWFSAGFAAGVIVIAFVVARFGCGACDRFGRLR